MEGRPCKETNEGWNCSKSIWFDDESVLLGFTSLDEKRAKICSRWPLTIPSEECRPQWKTGWEYLSWGFYRIGMGGRSREQGSFRERNWGIGLSRLYRLPACYGETPRYSGLTSERCTVTCVRCYCGNISYQFKDTLWATLNENIFTCRFRKKRGIIWFVRMEFCFVLGSGGAWQPEEKE